MAGKRFHRLVTGNAPIKDRADYQVVGQAAQRIDLVSKVCGGVSYVHDLELPGMLHARVIRPPSYHARLVKIDAAQILKMPGVVKLVRDGQFIGLAAAREDQVIRAHEQASIVAEWQYVEQLPAQDSIFDDLLDKAGAFTGYRRRCRCR